MGGSSGGGSDASAESSAEAKRLAKIQADIAQGIFKQSGPTRGAAFDTLGPMVGQAADPITLDSLTQNPMFGALKHGTETQFDLGRERLIEDLPVGGTLAEGLSGLETGRSSALTAGFGNLAADELQRRERNLDRGLAVATGVPSISLGGLGSASNTLNQIGSTQASIAESQANRGAGKAQGMGQAAGSIGAAAVTKCSLAYKRDVTDVADAEMLERVNSIRVARFRYKPGHGVNPDDPLIGPIAEDTPADFRTEDGMAVYPISLIGGLICSVRELTARVADLEGAP